MLNTQDFADVPLFPRQFLIFCYIVLYELLWREGYKLTVVPNGYVRLQTDYNVKTVPEISTMSYCTQSPTVYPGTKKQCIFIDDVECMQPRGQGWITVTTHIGINTEKRRQTWEKIPSKESYWVLDNAKSSNVYVANPEGMTIWVDHAAFAPTASQKRIAGDCSYSGPTD